MTVKLNDRAYEHAKRLVNEGKFVYDQRDAWSEHQPSARKENEFIERHGFFEYGRWYLGINDEYREDTKRYYEFPYGDFEMPIAAASSPQKAGPVNTSTVTSKTQRPICMV